MTQCQILLYFDKNSTESLTFAIKQSVVTLSRAVSLSLLYVEFLGSQERSFMI